MSTVKKPAPIVSAFYYSWIFIQQLFTNAWYSYFLLVGVMLLGGYFQAVHLWQWCFIVTSCLFPGWVAVTSAISRVDCAFQDLPLRYSPQYGLPRWLVRGKYPLRQRTLEISAAGLGSKDFEEHLDKISTRLCEPIREISKPAAKRPVILIELGESRVPSHLNFGDLPWDDLKQGQFFFGQGEKGVIAVHLSKMVHLLVAGQTGMGKTAFERQLLTSVLSRTRHSHALVLDMKGGVDFHQFQSMPNFEIATEPSTILSAIEDARRLVDLRKDYIAKHKKEHWDHLSAKDLERDPAWNGLPIGHVLIVVDELAELVYQMENKKQADDLQKKLSTFPRLSRSTSVHLIVGTQRPDKRILDGQSKDNMVTAICFSVPSVQASNLVIGDKSASTLGSHRGRAVYRSSGNQIIQTPYLDRTEIASLLEPAAQRLQHSGYDRKIRGLHSSPSNPVKRTSKVEIE